MTACSPACGFCNRCTAVWERDDDDADDLSRDREGLPPTLAGRADAEHADPDVERCGASVGIMRTPFE